MNFDEKTYSVRYFNGGGKSSKRQFNIPKGIPESGGIVPGTANFVFDEPVSFPRSHALGWIARNDVIWRAKINGRPCLAFRFKQCPLHIVELMADYKIAEAFSLKQGDRCDLTIVSYRPSGWRRLIWTVIWGKERNYYTAGDYVARWDRVRGFYRMACQRTKPL